MSKETLEEAAERFFPTNRKGSMWIPNVDEVANKYRQEGFNHGAKWQADRMYTEEDMREAIRFGFDKGFSSNSRHKTKNLGLSEQEWFEQLKKK